MRKGIFPAIAIGAGIALYMWLFHGVPAAWAVVIALGLGGVTLWRVSRE